MRLLAATALALYSLTGWAQGWPFYGGNSGGTHYSAAAQIDRNNVDQLEVAWIHRSGDSKLPDHLLQKTSGQSTPILLPPEAGASLVYCSALNKVMALDPGSGAQRWAHDPKINVQTERPLRCRGVSYYEEKRVTPGEPCRHRIFTITYDRRLIALDALDGKRCKDFGNKGEVGQFGNDMSTDYISNSSPPVAAAGLIIAGSAVIDFHYAKAPRGTVQAFDSLTGKLTWSFDPVAGLKNSGGANVWAPMSIDENLNLLYLPTSAASPDYYGVNRPGDNGYANSVVALDLQSGEVRWHFQHVRHDLWDYDSPAQPILFDWKKNGASIPALAQPTKQGFVFVLDRRTGESLWEITEQPVPPSQIPGEMAATTQPKPIAPPPLLDTFLTPDQAWGLTPWDRGQCAKKLKELDSLGLFTPLSEKLTLLLPGSLGGANWGGGAVLADSGILILNINTAPFTGQLIATASIPPPEAGGDHPTSGQRFQVPMKGTPYTVELGTLVSSLGIPCSAPPWGKLMAVDLVKGKILWEAALGSVHEMGPFPLPFHIEWGTPNLGGGIATAGGLFFVGATMDRQLRAFDVSNGETLWRYTLPVDAAATPMTYTYRGRQYLVINAGGHFMFNREQSDYLFAFALPEN